jgi:hypothetical protein
MKNCIFFIALFCLSFSENVSAQQIKTRKYSINYDEGGEIAWDEIISAPNENIRRVLTEQTRKFLIPESFKEYRSLEDIKKTQGLKINPKVRELLDECPQCNIEESVVTLSVYDIASVTYSFSEFCCGAHLVYGSETKNFQISTGKSLELKDIFKPGYEAFFKKRGEEIIRREHELPEDVSLADYGYDGFYDGFVLPVNVNFLEDGMLFYFNPYEAGPWAMPPLEFQLTYAEVKNFIKPDGPLAAVLGAAEKTPANVSTFIYKGTIRGDLKITMTLTGNNTVSGHYYYESQGPEKKIKLTGKRNGVNVTLTESVNDKITGTFDLLFSADGSSASGTWTGPKGQKLAVSLKKQ